MDTKSCTKCGETFPLSEFHRYRNGHKWWCKTCCREYLKEWKQGDASLEYRERHKLRQRERHQEQKREAMDAYGGVCACCGEAELVFLAIDHVNDDGAQHRRDSGMGRGPRAYRWLRDQGYPEGFQVLCHNCNYAKHRGICPHQLKEGETDAKP
jgi:hypothetical protein